MISYSRNVSEEHFNTKKKISFKSPSDGVPFPNPAIEEAGQAEL